MHSLNCPQCKAEGLVSLYLLGEDCDCAIFIVTVVLGVGIDVQDIDSVIDYPCFSSLASLVQHAGRPARGRGLHSEAIIYIKRTDIEKRSHRNSPSEPETSCMSESPIRWNPCLLDLSDWQS